VPCVAKRQINTTFYGQRNGTLVSPLDGPTKAFLESIDPGALRSRFVLKQSSPIVARYAHFLEPQHVPPVQPGIGAPYQRPVISLLVAKTGTAVLEPRGRATKQVSVPDQHFAASGC